MLLLNYQINLRFLGIEGLFVVDGGIALEEGG